jgi:hypothetical protein
MGDCSRRQGLIKIGSRLRIEGFHRYSLQGCDVGGAIKGKRIDLWFSSHRKALEFGRQKLQSNWYWFMMTKTLIKTGAQAYLSTYFWGSVFKVRCNLRT